MDLHLILIGLISTASCILIMLCIVKNDNKPNSLSSQKKCLILLSISLIFFLSLNVSNFKSGKFSNMYQNMFYQKDAYAGQPLDIKNIFYGSNGKCQINRQAKYPTINEYFQNLDNQKLFQELTDKNYEYLHQYSKQSMQQTFLSPIQELIIFKSQKNQGASYFLSKVGQNLCNKNQQSQKTAVLYLKLKEDIINEKSLMKHIKMNNYEQLKSTICMFNDIQIKRQYLNGIYKQQFIEKKSLKRSKVYLIIDNFQYILHTKIMTEYSKFGTNSQMISHNEKYQLFVDKLLKQLVLKCKANVIMNTQHQNNIQKLFIYWQSINSNPQDSASLKQNSKRFPFQTHSWIGLSELDIYQIVKLIINSNQQMKNRQKQFLKTYDDYKKNGLKDYQSLQKLLKTFKMMSQNNEEWRVLKKKSKDQIFQFNTQVKQNVADFFGYQRTFKLIKQSSCQRVSCLKNKISLGELAELQKLSLIKFQQGEIVIK